MSATGLNMRSTSGFVTDPAGTTYCLSTDTYPTTRDGLTFGWLETPDGGGNDVNNAVDARVAGKIAEHNVGLNTARLRIDLTGSMTVELAAGTPGDAHKQLISVQDSGGEKFAISSLQGAGGFTDAGGNIRTSEADWASNQVPSAAYSFTDYVIVRIGNTAGVDDLGYTTLNHVKLIAQASGNPYYAYAQQ